MNFFKNHEKKHEKHEKYEKTWGKNEEEKIKKGQKHKNGLTYLPIELKFGPGPPGKKSGGNRAPGGPIPKSGPKGPPPPS